MIFFAVNEDAAIDGAEVCGANMHEGAVAFDELAIVHQCNPIVLWHARHTGSRQEVRVQVFAKHLVYFPLTRLIKTSLLDRCFAHELCNQSFYQTFHWWHKRNLTSDRLVVWNLCCVESCFGFED